MRVGWVGVALALAVLVGSVGEVVAEEPLKLLWKKELKERSFAFPVAIGDGIIAALGVNGTYLSVYDLSGSLLWTYNLSPEDPSLRGSPVIETVLDVSDKAVVLAEDKVRVFGSNGSLLFATEPASRLRSGFSGYIAIVNNDRIFTGARGGALYTIDLTGKVLWNNSTVEIARLYAAPGMVIVDSLDKVVYAFDLDGNLLWRSNGTGKGVITLPYRPIQDTFEKWIWLPPNVLDSKGNLVVKGPSGKFLYQGYIITEAPFDLTAIDLSSKPLWSYTPHVDIRTTDIFTSDIYKNYLLLSTKSPPALSLFTITYKPQPDALLVDKIVPSPSPSMAVPTPAKLAPSPPPTPGFLLLEGALAILTATLALSYHRGRKAR